MRAARLLDMLLILQRQGRTPARRLAETLEVSERTILRDVEALNEAGVPIHTRRGSHGGIELLEGFETNLTGLTIEEARSLLLIGQPRVAHRLGVAGPARTARAKLLTALPAALTEEAETLTSRFLHDPDPWRGNDIPHGELRRVLNSIRRHRKIELTFDTPPNPLVVRPMGLVLKVGSWNLVHFTDPAVEVLCLDHLRATRLTNLAFTPPESFDLSEFWNTHLATQESGIADSVTPRVT